MGVYLEQLNEEKGTLPLPSPTKPTENLVVTARIAVAAGGGYWSWSAADLRLEVVVNNQN